MDIKALRYFLKISETGSFLETARQLNVPISSVSRFVSALEKDLGQQLLYRSTRSIRLTEEGLRFQLKVRSALEMLDEARQELSPANLEVRGAVSINAPLALGRIHIAPLLNKLLERYPHLKVELSLTDSFVDPVQEGSDIIFRVGKLVDSSLIGKFVAPQRFVCAASPRYVEKFGIPKEPADLQTHNCLLYKGRYGIQRWYLGRHGTQDMDEVTMGGSFLSNCAESLVSAALDGRGIVLFPTWLFDPRPFENGNLVRLFDDWRISAYPGQSFIQILSPENRLRSRKIQEVCKFLISEIGPTPYWDVRMGIGPD